MSTNLSTELRHTYSSTNFALVAWQNEYIAARARCRAESETSADRAWFRRPVAS